MGKFQSDCYIGKSKNMDHSENTIQQAAIRYFNGAATATDEEKLFRFIKASAENERLFRQWEAEWRDSLGEQPGTEREWARLKRHIMLSGGQTTSKVYITHFRKARWVAAAILVGFLVAAGCYLGTVRYLGRVADNDLFVLHTGRAEKTQLALADGTTVYLNAGSSLQYSGNFNRGNRTVRLSGEAYFKVTRQPDDTPFTVETDACKIIVKGTQFNVTAYPEAPTVSTVLLDGAVEMNDGNTSIAITPGELLTLDKTSGLFTKERVQADQYIAWTEGRFDYDKISLQELMDRLSRKYDVNIELDEQIKTDVVFRISLRNEETIEDILKALTQLVPLRYEKNGRHIRIYK